MDRLSFYDAIAANKRNSFLLSIFVFLILVGVMYIFYAALGAYYGYSINFGISTLLLMVFFALIVFIPSALYSFYKGQDVVLMSCGAYPAEGNKFIYLNNAVEGVSLAAGVPAPKVYVIPSKDINAFAAGRDPKHAVVAVTEGALEKLNRQELEGVVAHELSHVRNYDIRFAMLVAVLVGMVAILSDMFLRSFRFRSSGGSDRGKGGAGLIIIAGIILAIVAPIVVRLVQLAISRQREYLADASAVQLTRYPPGLEGALEKIKEGNKKDLQVSEAVSHLFIDDPKNTFVDSIFETHPHIEDRIKRLKSM